MELFHRLAIGRVTNIGTQTEVFQQPEVDQRLVESGILTVCR